MHNDPISPLRRLRLLWRSGYLRLRRSMVAGLERVLREAHRGTRWSRRTVNRYAAQRRTGFPFLRFVPDLERDYRNAFLGRNALRIQIANITGVFAVLSYIPVDYFLGSRMMPASATWVLSCISVPALLIPVAVTLRRRLDASLQSYVFAGTLLMGVSLVWVIHLGMQAHPQFPYASMILITTYIYFLSGLLFFQALACGTLVGLSFLASQIALDVPLSQYAYPVYFMLLANFLGGIGLYIFEYRQRLAYLLEHELKSVAFLDSLTGALNRGAFRTHLHNIWHQARRERQSIGLVMIDVDQFKTVNDHCGHLFGDTALKQVARTLRESARRPLDAVGRYGGDEFIAVWYGIDAAMFVHIVQSLPQRLPRMTAGEPPLTVSISGGAVRVMPHQGSSMNDAILAADAALYAIKRNGRGAIGLGELEPAAS